MYIIILRLCDSHIIHIGVTRRCNINKATFCQKNQQKQHFSAPKSVKTRGKLSVFLFSTNSRITQKQNIFWTHTPGGNVQHLSGVILTPLPTS